MSKSKKLADFKVGDTVIVQYGNNHIIGSRRGKTCKAKITCMGKDGFGNWYGLNNKDYKYLHAENKANGEDYFARVIKYLGEDK